MAGGRKKPERTIREAAVRYQVDAALPERPRVASSRLSSKNQITLPVAMVRELGLQPGDELNVWLEPDHLVVEKRLYGQELLDQLQGSVKLEAWSTKEKVDKWIRDLRDEWERD